jgi:hypothetical protein
MDSKTPEETFPSIGTVEDPAYFRDCERNLLLCYEIAPVDGGGNVILEFGDVVYFEQNPNNVSEGLRNSKYPVRAWDFTEVLGSDRTERWQTLNRRFWTISFNDWMLEVVFSRIRQVHLAREPMAPDVALLEYLRAR